MNDDISPDIAALLADTDSLPNSHLPSLDEIPEVKIEPAKSVSKSTNNSNGSVDLTQKTFKPIEKYYMDSPNPVFTDNTYYKTTLSGENESAQRLHAMLTKYLTCQDIKDKTVYRQQIVPIYWEFLKSVALKMNNSKAPMCKRMLLRYGVVLPSLFTSEQKDLFSKVFYENTIGEPIYYLDEWFQGILSGKITLSATDEAKPKNAHSGKGGNNEEAVRLMQLQTKNNGKLQNAENMLKKAKAAGFTDAFIATTETPVEPKPEVVPEVETIKVGDKVKMAKSAPVYGKTTKFSSWVYDTLLYVREIKGSRVVISTQATGAVTGAVDINKDNMTDISYKSNSKSQSYSSDAPLIKVSRESQIKEEEDVKEYVPAKERTQEIKIPVQKEKPASTGNYSANRKF